VFHIKLEFFFPPTLPPNTTAPQNRPHITNQLHVIFKNAYVQFFGQEDTLNFGKGSELIDTEL